MKSKSCFFASLLFVCTFSGTSLAETESILTSMNIEAQIRAQFDAQRDALDSRLREVVNTGFDDFSSEQKDALTEAMTKFASEYNALFNASEIADVWFQSYQTYLTPEEIVAITDLIQSDLGKKMLSANAVANDAMTKYIQLKQSQEVPALFQKYLSEVKEAA